jgi:membrane associated rhomboid family serine protease
MLKNQNPFRPEFFKYIGLIANLGISVVLTIILCFLGFNYFDKIFHTQGILKIVGVLAGVVLGMFVAYRQIKKYYKNNDLNANG